MSYAPDNRGFTLIELMAAMLLFAVAVTASFSLLIGVNGSSQRVSAIGDVQSTARLALDELALEIQQAGMGASHGQVLVGQGIGRRLPVIWSGPNITITEPGGQALVTNSIYVLGSEPVFVGRSMANVELLGTVAADSPTGLPAPASSITLYCADSTGTTQNCLNAPTPGVAPGGPLAGATLPPLLIGDFRDAAFVTPTDLTAPAPVVPGGPARQTMKFAEQATASTKRSLKMTAFCSFSAGGKRSRSSWLFW